MNPDHERLLKEILSEDREDFRQTTLDRTLHTLRHRRRNKKIVLAGTTLALTILVGLHFTAPSPKAKPENHNQISFIPSAPLRASAPPRSSPSVVTVIKTLPTPPIDSDSHVKILSDLELMALFPEADVALIGKPGNQQLILLTAQGETKKL